MPQTKANWADAPPRDWEETQAHRVALEIRRLRGKRSAQWLADKTKELGCAVTRTVISDLEVGRRRYVTLAELVVLALALDTAPVSLIYPAPYWDRIEPFPTPEGAEALEVSKLWSAQWFSGLSEAVDIDVDGQMIVMNLTKAMNYDANVKALKRARRAARLAELKHHKADDLKRARHYKETGERDVSDQEIADLVADIADLAREIDEFRSLGSWDLTAEAHDQLFGRRGDQVGG
jgi:hypothetical protein